AGPAPVEELAPAGEAGEHRGHVVGGPPHETVRPFGPEPVDGSPSPEVVRRSRDEPHGADAAAARRIGALRDVGRLARRLVTLGDAPDRRGEGGALGEVGDARAVEEDGAAVAKAGDVLGRPAHAETLARGVDPGKTAAAAGRPPRRVRTPPYTTRR